MAFIGVLLLSFIGMAIFAFIIVILIFIALVFIFVFIPSLIISIVNLVLGIKRHWPKVNIILLSIFGSLTLTLFSMGIVVAIFLAFAGTNYAHNTQAVETVTLLISPVNLLGN